MLSNVVACFFAVPGSVLSSTFFLDLLFSVSIVSILLDFNFSILFNYFDSIPRSFSSEWGPIVAENPCRSVSRVNLKARLFQILPDSPWLPCTHPVLVWTKPLSALAAAFKLACCNSEFPGGFGSTPRWYMLYCSLARGCSDCADCESHDLFSPPFVFVG